MSSTCDGSRTSPCPSLKFSCPLAPCILLLNFETTVELIDGTIEYRALLFIDRIFEITNVVYHRHITVSSLFNHINVDGINDRFEIVR